MSTTTTQSTLPAKPKASQLITQGNAADFEVPAAEDLLGVMEEVRGKDINAAVPSSINMVTTYLKFSKLKGQPQRRSFMGWTARPLVDYKTKEPICDENTGEQLYGPAVIFYNHETEAMEVNQAFDILKTMHESKPKKGTGVEITYLGLEPTEGGRNKQTFKIIFLKNEA